MTLNWCDEASGWIDELTKDNSPVDFLLFTLESNNTMVMKDPTHRGKGGRQGIHDILSSGANDDVVMTGAFLASAIDDSGSVVSVRRKYIHVLWVGPKVKIMVKGKVNSWSGNVRDKFPGCALYLQFMMGGGGGGDDLEDLEAGPLEAILLASGGAHKPTRYSFTNRTLIGTVTLPDENAEDARRKAEEDRMAALRAQEAARRRAREEAKAAEAKRAEEEAQRMAEEEIRRQAEADAEDLRRKAEEKRMATMRAQEEARRLAQAQRLKEEAEAEAKRLAALLAEQQRSSLIISKNATLGPGRKLVLLISTMSGKFQQTTNQSRLQIMVDGLGIPKIQVEIVDGSDGAQTARRNALFGCSGIRAKYPQVFLVEGDTTTFVGDYDTMEYYNDTGTLAQTLGVTISTTQTEVPITTAVVAEMAPPMEPASAPVVPEVPKESVAPEPESAAPEEETGTSVEEAPAVEAVVAAPEPVAASASTTLESDTGTTTTTEPATVEERKEQGDGTTTEEAAPEAEPAPPSKEEPMETYDNGVPAPPVEANGTTTIHDEATVPETTE